jgi:hypothetical protein
VSAGAVGRAILHGAARAGMLVFHGQHLRHDPAHRLTEGKLPSIARGCARWHRVDLSRLCRD